VFEKTCARTQKNNVKSHIFIFEKTFKTDLVTRPSSLDYK